MRDRSRSLRRGTCHCAQQSGRFSPFQGLVSVWPRIRELTSSANTGRQERVTAWSVADRVRSVPPTLLILVGWRLLRYDGSLRKAGCGTPALTRSKRGEPWPSAPPLFDFSTSCSALRSCAFDRLNAQPASTRRSEMAFLLSGIVSP